LKSVFALLILIGGSSLASYLMTVIPGGIDRHAADLNTLFNVVIGICTLPILGLISRGLTYLIPSQTLEEQDEPGVFLDPLLLQTPSLALSQAAREELRMLDHLKLMLRTVWTMRTKSDRQAKIRDWHDRIAAMQAALKDYVSQIGDENLSETDVDWRFNLLDYSQELAIVATLIKRDLADASFETARSSQELRPEDRAELESILNRTVERMQKATVLLMTQDVGMAHRFIQEKEEISNRYRAVRRRHLERLAPGQKLDTCFFDLLNCFRRINTHLTAVAYAIVRSADGNTGTHNVDADPDESSLTGDEAGLHQKTLSAALSA
jgi:phosphate:Na+ symporter